MQETLVSSLGREDPLEKEMATHSSILAWRIPWREEPGRLQSVGLQDSDVTDQLSFLFLSNLHINYFIIISFFSYNLNILLPNFQCY